jgi:hypothetical protein
MSVDLLPFIDAARCTVSNSAPGSSASALFASPPTPLSSDADAQLLITVFFTAPVKITGFSVRAAAGSAPTVVKLYADRPVFTFDDVGSSAPTASFALSAAAAAGKALALNGPGVKFPPSATSVTVFLDNEDGADATTLASLTFFGAAAAAGADLTKLRAG